MTDHNAHVYAFWNAPLGQRVGWVKAKIIELTEALARGGYCSPDAYYDDKDRLRQYEAALVGKTARKYDPMGYWYGMQSN